VRVLVTNDDGVRAPGIAPLAAAVVAAGHDVVVAAPQEDMSGSSAAIGRMHADETIDLDEVDLPGVDAPCFGVLGPPALAVMAARLGGFGEPPAVVVSGINPGPNTGRAVLHSGTVGAALTAANFGVSGVAVSIDIGDPYHWETAADLAVAALAWLVEQPPKTVLNLNVPNLPLDELRGVRAASLAPFGTVRAALVESQGGGLQMELAEHGVELPADSDTALVKSGWAALTSLVGIRAVEGQEIAAAVAAVDAVLDGREARSA
jgi:5'/3'-nucleotidase